MSKKAPSNSAVSALSTATSSTRSPINRSSNANRYSTNSIGDSSNEVPPNPTQSSATTSSTSDTSNPLETNVTPIQASNNSNDANYNTTKEVVHRIKKRPITGVLGTDADAELTW